MELVCPAGNLPALRAAVDEGADAVYTGFKDETNARHFSGLNFTADKLREGVTYARRHGVKVFIAINTYPRAQSWSQWQTAVDCAAELGVDAVIAADIGVLGYAAQTHPDLPLHLSVQGSVTNAAGLEFYREQFNIRRAVLPRVLSLRQVEHLCRRSPVALEVFGFGSLCIMAEGRCHLSSYVTSESPNRCGACSPAKYVSWSESSEGLSSRLNGVLIDRYREGESASYPTLCKGRFVVEDRLHHALEEPTSLNTLDLLPQLHAAGIEAIKIEGRQRSPAYVRDVVRTWRQALDTLARAPEHFYLQARWKQALARLSEGSQTTLGAYDRRWQ